MEHQLGPIPDDRCAPLRRRLEDLEGQVAQIRDDLSNFDIPPDTRERLEALLERRLAAQSIALRALEACEAGPAGPRPPDEPRKEPMSDDGDPCAPIREQLFAVDDEFVAVTSQLADPEIAPDVRADLEARLPGIQQRQRSLLTSLAACESQPPVPLEP